VFGKHLRTVDTSLLSNFQGARYETTPNCCATINRILLNFTGSRVVACTSLNNLNGLSSLECQEAVDKLNEYANVQTGNSRAFGDFQNTENAQTPPAYKEKELI
jgi:hypothetical protein